MKEPVHGKCPNCGAPVLVTEQLVKWDVVDENGNKVGEEGRVFPFHKYLPPPKLTEW